ncbi:MAG: hypothetical protein OXF79_17025 [Chloroflexi bacterium]|nr:hypothetical protein [Chloroflexota bacterium]
MTAAPYRPPRAIYWRNLILAGRDLLNLQRTGDPPTDEHIRRAISSAYYATFHALAASNADVLIGTPHDSVTEATWTRVYRGLDHTTARRELQRHRHTFSAPSQTFADTFQHLQNRRHSADYDPNAIFTANQPTIWLAEAEVSIIDYLQVERGERAYIAALTLIRGR